ncbi:hypothetical protein Tcan_00877, partial [Toxocara canis]
MNTIVIMKGTCATCTNISEYFHHADCHQELYLPTVIEIREPLPHAVNCCLLDSNILYAVIFFSIFFHTILFSIYRTWIIRFDMIKVLDHRLFDSESFQAYSTVKIS